MNFWKKKLNPSLLKIHGDARSAIGWFCQAKIIVFVGL